MPKLQAQGIERRCDARYAVLGQARVFFAGGDAEAVAISDMSAGGCKVEGRNLPGVGTKVFLSLDLGGLPNVRLPATVMRRAESKEGSVCGLHFDLPAGRRAGLAKLLNEVLQQEEYSSVVLVVDSDERSRERIALSARASSGYVIAVDNAVDAVAAARKQRVSLVVARADTEGLAALAALAQESRSTFRVAFGRGPSLATALTLGFAEACADDPCSAKCLSDLLKRRDRGAI